MVQSRFKKQVGVTKLCRMILCQPWVRCDVAWTLPWLYLTLSSTCYLVWFLTNSRSMFTLTVDYHYISGMTMNPPNRFSSIVFHNGSPRVLCGKLIQVE
jgi:hypothetical protein